MSSTTVYPNGDGTLGGWAISGGGTSNIYTTIDEGTASPNDSDSIVCSTGSSSYYVLLGDMPSDFGTATAVSIKVRAQYTSGKGVIKSFDCRLVQSDESTAITANTTTSASGSLTTYTISPSITGGTSKTVWDGARLKLTTASGASGGILVSAVQVEITYSTAGVTATPDPGALTAAAQTPTSAKSSSQSVVSLAATAATPSSAKSTATTAVALTASAHDAAAAFLYQPDAASLTISVGAADAYFTYTPSPASLTISAATPETSRLYHMATSWLTASVGTPTVSFVKAPDSAALTIAAHEPLVTEWHAPSVPLTITPRAPAGTKSHSTTSLGLTATVHTPNTYKGIFIPARSEAQRRLIISPHAPVVPASVSRVALTVTANAPHVIIPASSRSLTVASQLPIGSKKVTISNQSLTIAAHDAHVDTLVDVSRQRLRITPRVPRSVKVVAVSSLSLSLTGHAPTRTTKRATAGYASLAITPHAPAYSQTVRTTAVPLAITGRTPVSSKQFSTTANELQMQTNVCYNRKSFSVTRLPLTITPRTPNKTSFFRVSSLGLQLTPRAPLSSKSSTAGHGSLALSAADSSGRLGNLAADSGERRKWYRGSEYQPTGVGREDELRERYRSSNADEVRVVNPQR